ELAGLRPLGANVLAGLPRRGTRSMGQAAKHLCADTLLRWRRTIGMDAAIDLEYRRRRDIGGDLAQPHWLLAEGCGACNRHPARDALPVPLRCDGARYRGGLSDPGRIAAWFRTSRVAGTGVCRGAADFIFLRGRSDRLCGDLGGVWSC